MKRGHIHTDVTYVTSGLGDDDVVLALWQPTLYEQLFLHSTQ